MSDNTRIIDLLAESRRMVEEFSKSDLSNCIIVLDFICALESNGNVKINSDRVIDILESAGYESGVNTGEDFDSNNKENFARYIIGQALSGLKSRGCYSQVVHRFTDDLKSKFKD